MLCKCGCGDDAGKGTKNRQLRYLPGHRGHTEAWLFWQLADVRQERDRAIRLMGVLKDTLRSYNAMRRGFLGLQQERDRWRRLALNAEAALLHGNEDTIIDWQEDKLAALTPGAKGETDGE